MMEPSSAVSADIEIDLTDWYNICLDRPEVFSLVYFKHIIRKPSSKFHFLLYSLIKKINRTEYSNYIAVAAPRGNAKTQIMSVVLPIWCASLEQKKFIVLISETSGVAEANLESIKHELTTNEKLANDFPHVVGEGPVWRKEMIRTNNGIQIIALGSGKQIRGRVMQEGVRPSLILCHTAGTKLITPNGYKKVEDLKVEDIVYNHKWKEDKIIAWREYQWTGDYYKFRLHGHPEIIEATAGHKFFVRRRGKTQYVRTNEIMNCKSYYYGKDRRKYHAFYSFQPLEKLNVRELKRGDVIGYPINREVWDINKIAEIEKWEIYRSEKNKIIGRNSLGQIVSNTGGKYLPVNVNETEKYLKSKEFWWLAGCYLGDGTGLPHKLVISCNRNERDHINKIITYARNLEFGVSEYKCKYKGSENTSQVFIYSTILHDIVVKWKKRKNSHKVPSRSIEYLDLELQKELIKGYIETDGWRSKKQGIKITSVCLELLEFMQRILLRLNIISTIRFMRKAGQAVIQGRVVNTQDKYDLYFKDFNNKLGYNLEDGILGRDRGVPRKNRSAFIDGDWVWRLVRKIDHEYKTDIVYPFTVEKEHTYINQVVSGPNCDDILSDVFVRTKAQREFLKEWFTKAVLGMAGPGDKMDTIVVGTILNPNDLLSELLDPNKSRGWEGHRFKAVYQFSKSPLWREWEHIYIDRENPNSREDSLKFFNQHKQEMLEGTKVLWPEGDSYYSLMEYKITHGTRAFQSEKQSSPIDPSTTLFDNSKIVYYNRQQLIMEDLTIFGALDASSGQARKHGDLACVTTIGKHRKTGIIYVLDSWAKEAPPTDCISYMKQMHKMYRYTRFAVDSDSLKLLKSNIEHEIPDLRLTMYNLRIQKNKRFEKLEPLISNGTIQLLKAQLELLTEIDTYPKSEYDDALDSLEMAVTMSSNRSYHLRTY